MRVFCTIILVISTISPSLAQTQLIDAIQQLTRDTAWNLVAEIPVRFDTHHPQGFAFVDGDLFVSSVEVTTPTRRFDRPRNGMDRSPGAGKGLLYKMDMQGNVLAQIELGEGNVYHPGGIDYDGTHLWVPVAEYRPDSRSIVYRVNPRSLEVVEVLRVSDHIGGIVHNTDDNSLHGVSWGSRRFYTWAMNGHLVVVDSSAIPIENPSHYIDYQDCEYVSEGLAVCTGLATYQSGKVRFRLGGIELIDLRKNKPVYQVPLELWTENGKPLTQNPVAFDVDRSRLLMYAMPEDNQSLLYVYEADLD